MLMPKAVPSWYADKPCLPDAHSDSLLLMGHVGLQVSDLEASRRFYVGALGLVEVRSDGKALEMSAGLSGITLRRSSDAKAWPGHLYVWVRDTKAVLQRVEALGKELGQDFVEDVHDVSADGAADALELRDADGNRFMVNKAPRGYEDGLRRSIRGGEAPEGEMLAVVEAFHLVPPGVSMQVARFYRKFFGAAVTTKGEGWAVHFAPSQAFRQTLCFVDDEEEVISMESAHEICVYVAEEARFKAVFDRCADAGILQGDSAWAAALKAQEFRVSQCFDPESAASALEFETLVRLSSHDDCRLAEPGAVGS